MNLRQKVQEADEHGPECPSILDSMLGLESSWNRLL